MSTNLPPGWAWARLTDLGFEVRGQVVPEPGTTYDLYSVPAFPSQRPERIDGAGIKSGKRQVQPGDVLLCKINPRINRVWLVDNAAGHPQVASTEYLILRPHERDMGPFIQQFLSSPSFRRWIELSVEGATGSHTRAKSGPILQQPIPIAPLGEQKRIVAAIEEHFSRLDAAEATLRQSLKRLDTLRSCILTNAFDTRRDLPPTWRWSTVGDVAEVKSGIQKQPKRKPNKNPAPFLRVANVLRGELLLDEIHEIELFDGELERYRIRRGDLLVVEGNGSPAQIGRAASWSGQIANCVHQNHLIRVSPGPNLSPKFLSLYWNAPHTASLLRDVASSTSGLYTLSTRKVKSIPIPIAPLSEQERIAARVNGELEKLDRLRESIRYALDRVTSLRRSVLSTAFSGRLVLQDPTDEPASVLLERIAATRPAKPAHRRRTA